MEEMLTEEKIILESNQESINKMTAYIDDIYNELSEKLADAYGNIIIAMTEAVNNAINHGNKNDSSKKVAVKFKKSSHNISFTVQDEGTGFDYENLPDPTAPENLEKLNGRGVFLMKTLADEIEFHDNGKKIELTFNFQ